MPASARPPEAHAEVLWRRRKLRNNGWNVRQGRREATAMDSNSPKAHGHEGPLATVQIKPLSCSPPHKRTEERAPVRGSEFTKQVATPQGVGRNF
jgi:hypothetical protein